MKARYLRETVLEELRSTVGNNLERYRSGDFQYLIADSSRHIEGRFEWNADQLESLKVPNDSELHEEENCGACYQALSELTAYEARDERLWTFLTHTLMLNYTRARWPIPESDDAAISHILTHFFAKDKRQIERDNGASRLWWMARLCRRVQGLPLEECLRVLLHKSDVRANIIERPTVSQSTAVFSAIMKQLHASYVREKKLFQRNLFRPLMMRINSIGGVKLLDCMSEQQLTLLLNQVIQIDLNLASI